MKDSDPKATPSETASTSTQDNEEKPSLTDETFAAQTPLSLRAPGDHPYVEITREVLAAAGLEPEKLETEDESEIFWKFTTPEGLGVFVRLYRDTEGEMFMHLEARVCQLDTTSEFSVLRWMAESNSIFHFPFRLAVVDESYVAVQCRSYCAGFTPEHYRIRLETLLPFSSDLQDRMKRNFGLRPAVRTRYMPNR